MSAVMGVKCKIGVDSHGKSFVCKAFEHSKAPASDDCQNEGRLLKGKH
jgi:hypothetical protein